MLILTRRIGERIMVGDNVVFTILGVRGSQTSVGIEAPDNVDIYREEVKKRIELERLEKERNERDEED